MSVFIKVVDGVVVQRQPYPDDGFIEATNDTICGQLDNGDGTFSNPPPQVETERQVSTADLWEIIPVNEQRAITKYLNVSIADDTHMDHAVALDYQGKWTSQSEMNILSPDWAVAVGWLLARGLIIQPTHDDLLA